MAQTNLLELAKQGDPQAIATLMNRSLQPRGMTASVDRQGNCLYVMLQAEQVPNRQVLTAFVQNGISNLGVSSIQLVKIAGQQFGMAEPAWTQDLQIAASVLDDLELGHLGLENPEPSDLTAPPYEADISLDGLDDIAPAPDPVGDILSELTGSPRPVPPSIPTFEPEGLPLEDSTLDFENELASGDFSEDFLLEAIATDDTDSSNLSDDLLADLDLGTGLETDLGSDLMADVGSNDLGLEAFDDLETSFGESTDDDLGLGGLSDLESSLPASDADSLDSDFSEFDLGSDSFDSAFGNTTPSEAGMHDSGMREPPGEALLSDLDALESTQDWSLDEPDELLNDLGSLEDDLAQMGDEFLGIDAVTGEAQAGMGLEPDEFDLSADLSSEFSSDFSTEPAGEVDDFGTDLPELDLLDLSDSASALDTGSLDLTPEAVDFPLTDFDELSTLSSGSEPSSGLEDLDFGDSVSGDAEFGDTSLGDVEFGSTEFGSTSLDLDGPDLGDASLSDADFDFDLSSADMPGESAAADDLTGAFADLEADGTSSADDWQDAIAPEAIAAGYESEAQFDDLLADPPPTEFGSATDFTETAPTPAPYVAEEVSLDLDLDDIQLPPVTTESGDDWDADLEFGNLAGEDLSDFTANPAEPAETATEAAAELETLDLDSEFTSTEFGGAELGEIGSTEFGSTEFGSTEFGSTELGEFGSTEFTSSNWEISTPVAESGEFDENFDLEPAPALFPPDVAAPGAASPQSDSAPWLSELPPELVIDVTLSGLALDVARGETLETGAVGAIAEDFPNLAQDLDLEPQDLYFESSAADDLITESPSSAAPGDLDFDLGDLGSLDELDSLNHSNGSDDLLESALFEDTSDIPLSQLPTEIPSSEIREDDLGPPDFLDMPLSGVDFDEAAFSSAFNEAPVDDFTLEDETAPTEIMTPGEEILPSELLVDDLDASDGFELDNLGLGLDRPERREFQPAEPEAAGELGLEGLDEFDLDAPAADWQSDLEPLPETTFGLEDDDETTILLDPSTYPGSSFDAENQSPDLDREELDWLANEVAASTNPPASPLSAAEEGWSYGIPPAPRPPDESFAFPASAPATPDRAIAEIDRATEAANEEGDRAGGRVTNLLYAVLLALLAWILTLIGRSLWAEWSQPEPPPAPPVEVSPQSQEPEPGRSPFSTFS
ncbi:MAG: hypothetical protein OHK0037_29180 [Elainellaceae cyanobacterium]